MKKWLVRTLISLAVCSLLAVVCFWPVTVTSSAEYSTERKIHESFDRLRKILVRKDATKRIVEKSGMTVEGKILHDVNFRVDQDSGAKRPLLAALFGKNDFQLDVIFKMNVNANDPRLGDGLLKLKQTAVITKDSLESKTESANTAGDLQKYESQLQATSSNDGSSKISADVSLKIVTSVPRIFQNFVQPFVDRAARTAVEGQLTEIDAMVKENQGKMLVLPDFLDKN